MEVYFNAKPEVCASIKLDCPENCARVLLMNFLVQLIMCKRHEIWNFEACVEY